jgi:hypothetical protein
MAWSRWSDEERDEHRAAQLAAAQEVLAAEVAALVSGEDWAAYLSVQARLHDYSSNNVLLIHAQHARAFAEGRVAAAEPSMVAGYATWKALGRTVVRGQHGYLVLAPLNATRRVALGPDGSQRRLGPGERPAPGEQVDLQRVVRGFRAETVFDVSQTDGPAIPEPPRPVLLAGQAPDGLGQAVANLVRARGYSVGTVVGAAELGGANGITDFAARRVLVRSDMDDAAMVKTLVHEAAHVVLHEQPPGRDLPRALKEVEAESVAFVVAAMHGMDSGGYSFPYVATWAGTDAAAAVAATQARVARAAREVIAARPAHRRRAAPCRWTRPRPVGRYRQGLAARCRRRSTGAPWRSRSPGAVNRAVGPWL